MMLSPNILLSCLEQVAELGVAAFAVLFDDIPEALCPEDSRVFASQVGAVGGRGCGGGGGGGAGGCGRGGGGAHPEPGGHVVTDVGAVRRCGIVGAAAGRSSVCSRQRCVCQRDGSRPFDRRYPTIRGVSDAVLWRHGDPQRQGIGVHRDNGPAATPAGV